MTSPKVSLSKVVYSIIALVALIAVWLLVRTPRAEVDIITVTKGPFIESLRIDGTVRSKTNMTVSAFATGDLEQVPWKVGEALKKGQIITHLNWDYRKPVTSPLTGVISKIYRESAGPIARGEPILDVIDPQNLEIFAEALTTDATKVPLGAKVHVSGLGTGETLQATVVRISQAGFVKMSALGIEEERTEIVMAFQKNPPPKIGNNFHVELEIEISNNEEALQIPLGALFKDGQRWAVYLVQDGRARLRHVTVLKRSATSALLSSGLEPGEQVVLFPSDKVADGVKVRTRKGTAP